MDTLTALILVLVIALAIFVLTVTATQGGTEFLGFVVASSLFGVALVVCLLLLGAASEIAGQIGVAVVAVGLAGILLVALLRNRTALAILMAGIAGTFTVPGLLLILLGPLAAGAGVICLLIASVGAAVSLSVSRSQGTPSNMLNRAALVIIAAFWAVCGVVTLSFSLVAGGIVVMASVILAFAAIAKSPPVPGGPPKWSRPEIPNARPVRQLRRKRALGDPTQPRPSNFQRAWHVIRGLDRPDRRAS